MRRWPPSEAGCTYMVSNSWRYWSSPLFSLTRMSSLSISSVSTWGGSRVTGVVNRQVLSQLETPTAADVQLLMTAAEMTS